jgi:hypothetical protein
VILHRRHAPQVKRPSPAVKPRPRALSVSFDELDHDGCRFMAGDGLFCNAKTDGSGATRGSAWCAFHHARIKGDGPEEPQWTPQETEA